MRISCSFRSLMMTRLRMLLDKEGKSLNPVYLAAYLNPESQTSMAADDLGIVRRGLDGAGREL